MRPTFLEWNDSAVHHGQLEAREEAGAGLLLDDVLTPARTLALQLVEPHQGLGPGVGIDPRTQPGHSGNGNGKPSPRVAASAMKEVLLQKVLTKKSDSGKVLKVLKVLLTLDLS